MIVMPIDAKKGREHPMNSRSVLLAFAQNEKIKRFLMSNGLSNGMVQRFIAGETITEAIKAAQELEQQGVYAAMDHLGENVVTETEARDATQEYLEVLEAISQAKLANAYISVKLTAMGLDLGETIAEQNLRTILEAAQTHNQTFVRVDMEGSAYTERTVKIVRRVQEEFSHVGTVLQSYLYRTDQDITDMIAAHVPIRLVKGAYAEPASVAYPAKSDVDAAYVRQMKQLLSYGTQPAIATHDEAIIHQAKRFIREQRIPNENFEFQMLYGIRRDLQASLRSEGYRVRAYIPFGKSWYPYFMRRLAERPANLSFILRSLFKK